MITWICDVLDQLFFYELVLKKYGSLPSEGDQYIGSECMGLSYGRTGA